MTYLYIVLPLSFMVTITVGKQLIPYLIKSQTTQTIIDYGPTWHKFKEGTPIMGGLMIIAGVITSLSAFASALMISNSNLISTKVEYANICRLILGLIMALGFAAIGFYDDYIKSSKKRNLGLTVIEKLVFQFFVAFAYLATLYALGLVSTIVRLPFIGLVNFGFAYYPLCIIGIVFMVNSANLTDGVDGLASSVTVMCSIGMFVCSIVLHYYLNAAFALALAGGCLGFLIYNSHPAQIFMGDTGSMFLGACVTALAFGIEYPCILIISGFIYIMESATVIIQQTSKRLFHKKVFKMTPIHHHFELCKMSEIDITMAFTCVAAIGAIISILLVIEI